MRVNILKQILLILSLTTLLFAAPDYDSGFGHDTQAHRYHTKAVENKDSDAAFELARVYVHKYQDYEKAIEWYKYSAELEPAKETYYNIGKIYEEKLHNYYEAITWYNKALEMSGGRDWMSVYATANAYADSPNQHDKAIEWYKKCIDKSDCMNALGLMYDEKLKDKEKAKEWFKF